MPTYIKGIYRCEIRYLLRRYIQSIKTVSNFYIHVFDPYRANIFSQILISKTHSFQSLIPYRLRAYSPKILCTCRVHLHYSHDVHEDMYIIHIAQKGEAITLGRKTNKLYAYCTLNELMLPCSISILDLAGCAHRLC